MSEHLVRRGARYYYRRRVPTGLVTALGKKEIMEALGTADPAEARQKARIAAARADALFQRLRAGKLPPESRRDAWSTFHEAEWGDPDDGAPVEETQEEWEARHRQWFADALEKAIRNILEDRRIARASAFPGMAQAMPSPTPTNGSSAPENWLEAVREWERRRNPERGTVETVHRCIGRFWDINGKLPLRAVTRAHFVAFQTKLLEGGSSPATARAYLSLLKAVLTVAVDMGLLKANPAQGLRTEGQKFAKTARLPFTLVELKAILAKTENATGARYWLPRVSLYSGLRMEEIGQLAPGDVREETYRDGSGQNQSVHVIYATDEGDGQSLKNDSSRRRVPAHPELIKLGFIDFVRAKDGQRRVFSDLKADRHGRETASFSNWFSKLLREECEITDRRKTFHSFRHFFKDIMREHGVPEDVSDAITGHTSGSVARNYGGAFYPLRPLAEAMAVCEIHGL